MRRRPFEAWRTALKRCSRCKCETLRRRSSAADRLSSKRPAPLPAMPRIVFVTNIPAPYRERVHELVSLGADGPYHVIYAHGTERRSWKLQKGAYSHTYLKPFFLRFGLEHYVHVNVDVLRTLDALDPDVVITGGFSPTFLLAFLWCRRNRRHHIPFSDGWEKSEEHLTRFHRIARKYVYARSSAFIGASQHTLRLYAKYGVAPADTFWSPLCADNERFGRLPTRTKHYDVIWCGQFIPRKAPLFFAHVVALLKKEEPNIKVLLVGDGPLKPEVLRVLTQERVAFEDAGFVDPAALPERYAEARVLLFPTLQDAWGVVANEACAAGIPVITCANAGAANDLIRDGENGYVCELLPELWCKQTLALLRDPTLRDRLGRNAIASVQPYSYERAAQGILDAVQHACGKAWRA
jgi:glycosyltransferase involved in cell wall biosynthesis